VATPQAARGRAHPPCRHFKIQSCIRLGSAFEVAGGFQTAGLGFCLAHVGLPHERHEGGAAAPCTDTPATGAAQALGMMGTLEHRALASVAWACATLGHRAPALLDAVAARAVRLGGDQCSPQSLAMLLWALASAGQRAPPLFAAAEGWAVPRLREFTPHGTAMLLWAFASSRQPGSRLFPAALRLMPALAPRLNAQVRAASAGDTSPRCAMRSEGSSKLGHDVLTGACWHHAVCCPADLSSP
jgi:hypothetical protein